MDNNKPITLVHGVFGAGKSFVVSVLVILLYELYNGKFIADEEFRIVISSMTNGINNKKTKNELFFFKYI